VRLVDMARHYPEFSELMNRMLAINTLEEIEAWFSGVDRFFDGMLVLMDDRRRRPSRTDR
jgi:hypothetical protein